jgi:hypothetical protein
MLEYTFIVVYRKTKNKTYTHKPFALGHLRTKQFSHHDILTTFFLQRDCFYAKTSLGLFRDVSSFLVSSFKTTKVFPFSGWPQQTTTSVQLKTTLSTFMFMFGPVSPAHQCGSGANTWESLQ